MTYEQLAKANGTIKTTDIKGKEYAEVNQRIKVFRMLFPNGCIKTNILSLENGVVTMVAEIYDENKNLLATGTAQEKETSSFINKTSFIENCETSAVGRALGMVGIGIETSVASFEEVTNAIANQDKPSVQKKSAKGGTTTSPKEENLTEKPTEPVVEFEDRSREEVIRDLCKKSNKKYESFWEWCKTIYKVNTLDDLGITQYEDILKMFRVK